MILIIRISPFKIRFINHYMLNNNKRNHVFKYNRSNSYFSVFILFDLLSTFGIGHCFLHKTLSSFDFSRPLVVELPQLSILGPFVSIKFMSLNTFYMILIIIPNFTSFLISSTKNPTVYSTFPIWIPNTDFKFFMSQTDFVFFFIFIPSQLIITLFYMWGPKYWWQIQVLLKALTSI